MPADVESARHVVQGHRTYASDEDALKGALELLEDVAVETFGMCDGPIHILALLIEHGVGEIVVFIDDEVEGIALNLCLLLDKPKFSTCIVSRFYLLFSFFRIIFRVSVDKTVQSHA